MQRDSAVPVSGTVVVGAGDDCDRYHRLPALPWRDFACPISVEVDTDRMPRMEAELRGYRACQRPACFGETRD